MSEVAVVEQPEKTKLLVQYAPSDAQIAELKTQLSGLSAGTTAGYELVRKGIATTRKYRGDIEKRRVELKADALAWGRRVDAEAHRLTDLLMEIELPLRVIKDKVDDENERKRREAEEAERALVVAQAKAAMEAEEARLKAIRDAEESRLRADRDRLAAERAVMEAELKFAQEAQRAEQRRIDEERAAERAKLEAERKAAEENRRKEQIKLEADRKLVEKEQQRLAAEKERLERVEFERQAGIAAEKQARERLERERIEEAKRKKAEAEAAELERQRIEAARPDVQKIHNFGKALRNLPMPSVTNKTAHDFMANIRMELLAIVTSCETFTVKKAKAV